MMRTHMPGAMRNAMRNAMHSDAMHVRTNELTDEQPSNCRMKNYSNVTRARAYRHFAATAPLRGSKGRPR